MTVSFVAASAGVEATSITLPAHQAGDFLVIGAVSTGGTITVPAGWLVLGIRAAAGRYLVLCGKHAVSSAETSGTWTGANLLTAAVYRDAANLIGVSGAAYGAASNTSVTYGLIEIGRASCRERVLLAV
jgi:hypothetical protein